MTSFSPEGLPIPTSGYEPKKHGQLVWFDLPEYWTFFAPGFQGESGLERARNDPKRMRQARKGAYPVIFINGQDGSPAKHMYQALATSAATGGAVIGIYNAGNLKNNTGKGVRRLAADTFHSLSLKATSSLKMKLGAAIDSVVGKLAEAPQLAEANLAEFLEQDDAASATLFRLLVSSPRFAQARICAHSQGNLIACNALNALVALRGKEALSEMRMFAFGSPTFSWSDADPIVEKFEFSNDAITWMAMNSKHNFGIKKLGVKFAFQSSVDSPGSEVPVQLGRSFNPAQFLSHSYYLYLAQLWNALSTHPAIQ
jgi:hypothetical protein